jgi:ppGpp synthetase/RelA/SpoT-type nucleotidyltranferase
MPERTVEDRLREEYFDLLPEIQRVVWQLEAEIRFHTLHILHDLKDPEQLIVKSRVKDCESALKSLVRRRGRRSSGGEGRRFDPESPGEYSLSSLEYLAGVRVLVFPNRRLNEVDSALRSHFQDWTSKPIRDENNAILAPKYYGTCTNASTRLRGEYQIVPMLLGLFWEVEHSAMYKFRAVANSKEMKDRRTDVERALARFEGGVESFLDSPRS